MWLVNNKSFKILIRKIQLQIYSMLSHPLHFIGRNFVSKIEIPLFVLLPILKYSHVPYFFNILAS